MRTFFSYVLAVLLTTAYLLISPPSSLRVDVKAQVNEVETQETDGTLLKREGKSLFIETNDGTKQVTAPENINVTRNGSSVPLEEMEAGDEVEFKTDATGNLLEISSTSSTIMGLSRGTVMALGGILLIGIVGYFLFRGSQKAHIKTASV